MRQQSYNSCLHGIHRPEDIEKYIRNNKSPNDDILYNHSILSKVVNQYCYNTINSMIDNVYISPVFACTFFFKERGA